MTIQQQRQQWNKAQQQLSRQQLRDLRSLWLLRSSANPAQSLNTRRLQWLRLRCSLLLAQRRF
mgnify:CR=1 FL=1